MDTGAGIGEASPWTLSGTGERKGDEEAFPGAHSDSGSGIEEACPWIFTDLNTGTGFVEASP